MRPLGRERQGYRPKGRPGLRPRAAVDGDRAARVGGGGRRQACAVADDELGVAEEQLGADRDLPRIWTQRLAVQTSSVGRGQVSHQDRVRVHADLEVESGQARVVQGEVRVLRPADAVAALGQRKGMSGVRAMGHVEPQQSAPSGLHPVEGR